MSGNMNIKLIPPTKTNPDGFRVFHLTQDNYYLLVSNAIGETTALPIVVIDFTTLSIVKFLDYKCQWSVESTLHQEEIGEYLIKSKHFVFQVEKRVAKEYIWFFLKEFAHNEFSLKIPSTISSLRYRHEVMDELKRQIQQYYYENTTTQS